MPTVLTGFVRSVIITDSKEFNEVSVTPSDFTNGVINTYTVSFVSPIKLKKDDYAIFTISDSMKMTGSGNTCS
jgi:hypothetical protein